MDQKSIEKVARLSKLKLTEAESLEIAEKLGGILKWVEQLNEVNTDGISDMVDWNGSLRTRKDEVTDGNVKEAVLANAPGSEFDCFVVPKVIE